MQIPLTSQVECTDGVYGRSAFVLIDPVVDQVASLVVKNNLISQYRVHCSG